MQPSKNQIPRKELTPNGKSNSDYGAIPAFFGRSGGELLGRSLRKEEAAVERVLGGIIAAGRGSLSGSERLPAGVRQGASQRVLQAALRDHLRDAGGAGGALTGPELLFNRLREKTGLFLTRGWPCGAARVWRSHPRSKAGQAQGPAPTSLRGLALTAAGTQESRLAGQKRFGDGKRRD